MCCLQVYTLQGEVADLEAAGEVTSAAVQGLEATLAAIERAESRRASQAATPVGSARQRSRTPPGRTAAAATAAGSRTSACLTVRTQAGAKMGGKPSSSGDDIGAGSLGQQLQRQQRGSSSNEEAEEAGWAADVEAAAGGSDGAAAGGSGSVALLSRELVKAQMGSADLQRKLRVSARWAAGARAQPSSSTACQSCVATSPSLHKPKLCH